MYDVLHIGDVRRPLACNARSCKKSCALALSDVHHHEARSAEEQDIPSLL